MSQNRDAPPRHVLDALAHAAGSAGIGLADATVRRTSSRWCLSVEHGDYNGTDLFGVGVDRFLWCAYRKSAGDRVRLFSSAFPDEGVAEFALGQVPPPRSPELARKWARFPMGAAFILHEAGCPLRHGIEGVIYSEIPGGGMSRSASLTLNLLLCLLDANDCAGPDRLGLASLAQAVENRYVGSPCGLMDQVMILFARSRMGVHFVPSEGRVEYIPLPHDTPDFRLVMLDTGTERPGLEHSTYRRRRQECATLVELLQNRGIGVTTLAEITPQQYLAVLQGAGIPGPLVRRLAYLHAAQARFPAMVEAWRRGDMETVGRIFRQDGIGLRDEYEISGPELEAMCDIARTVPGVLGERMLGGGDKGAAGAICLAAAVPALREAVARGYPGRFPRLADRWSVSPLGMADGVRVYEGCFAHV